MKKLLFLIIAFALLAGCAQSSAKPTATSTPGAAVKQVGTATASAQGYVTPVRRADLSFRTGGRVAEVLVKENDQVKAGQPLVKLQDAELRAALAAAQAELKHLQAGARPEEIAAAQANLDMANAQVKAAQVELDRIKSGVQQAAAIATAQAQLAQAEAQLKSIKEAYQSVVDSIELVRKYGGAGHSLSLQEQQLRVQLEAAQAAYDFAQKQLGQAQSAGSSDLASAQARLNIALGQRDAAQAQLNLLKAGATAEQIEIAQARVKQAQAALDEATLVAPFDGVVTSLSVNIGEMIGPASRVASIADLTQWQVETDDLVEMDIVKVQPGDEVTISVEALQNIKLKGTVTSIVARSAVKRGDVTYTVKIAIAEPDPRLKWGMTAFVNIGRK